MQFCAQHRSLCYMYDIPQITMFLCNHGLEHIGWVNVPSLSCESNEIVPEPARDPYMNPTIMAFDIEVRSTDLTMPKAYRLYDEIE